MVCWILDLRELKGLWHEWPRQYTPHLRPESGNSQATSQVSAFMIIYSYIPFIISIIKNQDSLVTDLACHQKSGNIFELHLLKFPFLSLAVFPSPRSPPIKGIDSPLVDLAWETLSQEGKFHRKPWFEVLPRSQSRGFMIICIHLL